MSPGKKKARPKAAIRCEHYGCAEARVRYRCKTEIGVAYLCAAHARDHRDVCGAKSVRPLAPKRKARGKCQRYVRRGAVCPSCGKRHA